MPLQWWQSKKGYAILKKGAAVRRPLSGKQQGAKSHLNLTESSAGLCRGCRFALHCVMCAPGNREQK